MYCFITIYKTIVETKLYYFISSSKFFISMLIWLICLPAGDFIMHIFQKMFMGSIISKSLHI